MVKSKAATVEEYLNELPPERREVVERVREVVLANLPDGYRESLRWGMISYEVPLERYPHTYNGQPLGYCALAAQKNYFALHLMVVYIDPERDARLREEFERAGKRLDMGKACLRFRRLEDLPLDVIGRTVASTTPERLIEIYKARRRK